MHQLTFGFTQEVVNTNEAQETHQAIAECESSFLSAISLSEMISYHFTGLNCPIK